MNGFPVPTLGSQGYRGRVERVGRWGPMTWRGWVEHGPMRTGSWYAWTEEGAARKVRRGIRRMRRRDQWRREGRGV